MADFHFIRPLWLLGLVPLAGLIWLLQQRSKHPGSWARVCDPHLLQYILAEQFTRSQQYQVVIYALSGLLAILAMAGPTWERLPTPAYQNQDALVLVFDLSMSMEVADIKPSRLERARYKVDDLLRLRPDGQTALVVFAGDAFTVTPLTNDTETIRHQLGALSTQLMPSQGSNAETGIEQALKLLQQAGISQGQVLLITDGVHVAAAEQAARELADAGHQLSVLGVGTIDGAPIKLAQGGFLKDSRGNIVIPRLEPETLSEVASAGNGRYHPLTTSSRDLQQLLPRNLPLDSRANNPQEDLSIEQWQERGPWLLLLLAIPALLVFRRGFFVFLLALMLPLQPENSFAAPASEKIPLWQTPEQHAQQAFDKGDYDAAARLFSNPQWKAASDYRAGRYEQALQALEGIDTSDAWYNRGNALQQLGRYQEAIEAYDRALELEPDNQDASFNRELARRQLEQQKQKQKQQQKQQQGGDQQESQEQDKDKQQSGDQQQDGNNSDSGESPDKEDASGDQQQAEKNQQELSGEQQADQQSQPDKSEDSEQQAAGQAQPEPSESEETEPREPGTPAPGSLEPEQQQDESEQARKQWLQRIPDDPGGLLRRKFLYQYQRLNRPQRSDNQNW